jgi:hypothetical protein
VRSSKVRSSAFLVLIGRDLRITARRSSKGGMIVEMKLAREGWSDGCFDYD